MWFAMNKKLFKWDFWTGVTALAIVIFGLFLIYPLFSLFASAFQNAETGGFSLENFARFFERKYYYQSMINSFWVTTCVTALAIVIGTTLAYFMSLYTIKFKNAVEICIIISLLSPPFIGAYSWILIGGRSGILTQFLQETFHYEFPSIYGFAGILLVLTLKLYPFIYLYVAGAMKSIDSALIEAAESLGCSGIRKVATVIVPLITPTILAGALMVFMNAMADFGTPMLIGEGFNVMPVMIYSEFINEVGDQANFAAAMAAIMVIITSTIFMLQKYVVNRKSFTMSSLRPMQVHQMTGIRNVIMHVLIYALVAVSMIPQLVVIYTSFLKTNGSVFVDGFSFDSYTTIFENLGTAISNTYLFSTAAIIMIIFLGMTVAYLTTRRKSWLTDIIDTLTMFPYIIPGSVLGITLLLAFNDEPLLLSGTAFIIIISLVIRRLPYTLRSSSAILYQISPSLEEASISLGASPLRTFFKVTAVMMLPGVMSGAILSWITAINELSSSVILFTGATKTMSVAIYTEVIRASYGTAAALSTILTVTTITAMVIFFKVSGTKDVTL
jgi:iron(III) transport system permease protein